jgi:hypothetical protein
MAGRCTNALETEVAYVHDIWNGIYDFLLIGRLSVYIILVRWT